MRIASWLLVTVVGLAASWIVARRQRQQAIVNAPNYRVTALRALLKTKDAA